MLDRRNIGCPPTPTVTAGRSSERGKILIDNYEENWDVSKIRS